LKHGAKVEETNENGHTPLVNIVRIAIAGGRVCAEFRWKQLVVDMWKSLNFYSIMVLERILNRKIVSSLNASQHGKTAVFH
jgi:hypothetical protein